MSLSKLGHIRGTPPVFRDLGPGVGMTGHGTTPRLAYQGRLDKALEGSPASAQLRCIICGVAEVLGGRQTCGPECHRTFMARDRIRPQ